MIKSTLLLSFGLLSVSFSFAQPNCEAFKYYGDTLKYKACKVAETAHRYYQFSREFQAIFDRAIAIDPTFDYAYSEKSVAYLKSGDFLGWKPLIDKAVALNPRGNLGYRGWCRYQFFRDYRGAIADIERLDSLMDSNIGFSVNGDYHLNVAKALCYKGIGQKNRAIDIIEQQLQDPQHELGLFDNLHLGVLCLETQQWEKAIQAFQSQSQRNELAENQYYLSLVYKNAGKTIEQQNALQKALDLYDKKRRMFDPYTAHMDKIYRVDIEREINALN